MSLSISVAMCTYNGVRFLKKQLASIAAQSRPPDELVVCDDCSSDGTPEVLNEFARSSRFATRFVVNHEHLGSTKNFEKAIFLCQGKIISLADQDDVWYRHKLERIEEAFMRSSAIVAAFSDADVIDEDARPLGFKLWKACRFDSGEQARFAKHRALEVLVRHPVVTGATMAFRRELFDIVAPIPFDHIHDRWISFLLVARGQFEVIREALMQYRQHKEQQAGLPPQKLSGLIAQAQRRGATFHHEEIDRFRQLRERLTRRETDFPYAQTALHEIERKVTHLTHRAQLPQTRIARLPLVLRESLNLGYWRYSAGWNSIARDLVIR